MKIYSHKSAYAHTEDNKCVQTLACLHSTICVQAYFSLPWGWGTLIVMFNKCAVKDAL